MIQRMIENDLGPVVRRLFMLGHLTSCINTDVGEVGHLQPIFSFLHVTVKTRLSIEIENNCACLRQA